jgi:hypothetical protein
MYQYFVRRKNRNKFNLDNTKIALGYNRIVISKPKNGDFKNPIIKLISNNLKSSLEYTFLDKKRIEVVLDLDTKKNYKLLIKDGLKSQTFDLEYTSDYVSKKEIEYSVEEYYKKGKIFFTLKKLTELDEDLRIVFEGDLNKTIIWKKGTKEVKVNFVHQIIGHNTLKFKINGKQYYKTVINPERFPTALIKTNEGVRTDKYCQYDLVLKTDISEHVLKGGETNFNLNLSNIKYMKLYFRDKLLFEQYLTKDKFLPLVTIVDSPLRIKLSQPYYEDVVVTLKGIDNKFVISQGNTFATIPYKKGLRKFVIESTENAIFEKKEFTLLLK